MISLFGSKLSSIMINNLINNPMKSTFKIGTYDSRVITLAYSRSDTFNIRLSAMQKQFESGNSGK